MEFGVESRFSMGPSSRASTTTSFASISTTARKALLILRFAEMAVPGG